MDWSLYCRLHQTFPKNHHIVYNHLESHKFLMPNNSGFREKHSTLISLLAAVAAHTKLTI